MGKVIGKQNVIGKIVLLFACVLLVCGSVSAVGAQTAEQIVSGEWIYTENAAGITLIEHLGRKADLYIPSEIDGHTVTQLGKELFAGQIWLRSVYIPGTVTVIGDNAFNGCVSLEKVTLSFSIKRIGNGVFRNCISLKEIAIPTTVTAIGNYTFAGCTSLSMIMMNGVRSVGESAFDGCSSLNSIVYSKRLTSIGAFAFRNTAWLNRQTDEFVTIGKQVLVKWNGKSKNVTIPYGTVMISGAFDGNEEIETVTLPDTVRNISQYAFRNAINLRSINIPQYMTTIGSSAFEGCISLETVAIPAVVRSLGASAFRGCSKLRQLKIPSSASSIPSLFLADCPQLRDVYVPEGVTSVNKNAFLNSDHVRIQTAYDSEADHLLAEYGIPHTAYYQQTDDLVWTRDRTGICIADYRGTAETVVIPEQIEGISVSAIGTAAFQNNSHVRSVILPGTIRIIGDRAFSDMKGLETVSIESGVHTLGAHVFTGTPGLKFLRIPASVSRVGRDPLDREADTVICAKEGLAAARALQDMGYEVQPYTACELSEDGTAASETAAESSASPVVLQIPDGLTSISADMVDFVKDELILFVPESVEEIDAAVCTGRDLTIVADPGTYAETFADEHSIRFLIPKNYMIF